MPIKKFYFESMTDAGKQISGYLFADDKIRAREKLNKNGMVVMSLTQYQEEKMPEGIRKFEFEAMDKEGKIFHGEVEAIDEYDAYKKLVLDYEFTVNFIVDVQAEKEVKEKLKKQGVSPSWAIKLKEEKKEKVPQKEIKNDATEKLNTILEEKQEKMEFLQKQIDEIIEKVQILINKHENILQPDKRRFIQSTLDRMSRLRRSNSIKHLKSIMLELFELLSSDDIFIDLQGEMLEDMESIKGEFKTFSLGFTNKINKGLASVSIDTDKIKENLEKILHIQRLIKEVFEILYFFIVGMLVSGILFLGVHGIKGLINNDLSRFLFYLYSSTFWFLFFFAFLLGGYFVWQTRKGVEMSFQKNIGITILFLMGVSVLVLEFPVLFFWTTF